MSSHVCETCGLSPSTPQNSSGDRNPQAQRIDKPLPPSSSSTFQVVSDQWKPTKYLPSVPETYEAKDFSTGNSSSAKSPRSAISSNPSAQFSASYESAPYESYLYGPQTQWTSPNSPYSTIISPSVVDSTSSSSTISPHDSSPYYAAPPVASYPATTSRHNTDEQRHHTRPSVQETSRRKPSLASRCKAALKGLFTHDPIDESQLEHIETRHWTD